MNGYTEEDFKYILNLLLRMKRINEHLKHS